MSRYNAAHPFSPKCLMTRLFFALLLSIGLAASAPAFAQESEASRVPAASAGAEAVALSEASAAAVASDGVEATATGSGQVHRIREMLTRKFGLARVKAEQISAAVMTSASKYSLPPALVLAIISIESRFQDHARGRHGATGLMQVVPAAHKGLVKNLDLTEPATNIEAGSAILHGYLESARGDVGAALKSYGGSTAYARKVSLRAKDFEVVEPASDAAGVSAAR
jgi:soluble lytic murein transglycosylase-like protein